MRERPRPPPIPARRPRPSPARVSAWIAASLLTMTAGSVARADDPLSQKLGPSPIDQVLPTGREVAPTASRPTDRDLPERACSFREAVCVHAPANAPPAPVLAVLRDAESALSTYRALGLPAPLPDGDLGGSPALDLYLGAPPGVSPNELLVTIDLLVRAGGLDTASAFALMPLPRAPESCVTGSEVARAVAQAIALRLDPGMEEGTLAMASSYLASLAAPCSLVELAAVDDFQEHPERALTAGSARVPDGALLFPAYLEATFGQGPPGTLLTALLDVSDQRTKPGSWQWSNEPDLFDALRENARDRGSSLDQLLLDFAVSRAFVGTRSDEGHMPDMRRFGEMGRVRFEWSIPYSTLPRRLAPSRPIDPTGMTYLWVDLTGAPPDGSLTLAADWELPSIFRWSLVKVDKAGAEAGRVDVAGVYGDSHVERTVSRLGDLSGILVVGVNAGSIDRGHPFDPDEAPFMPHGYTVTLAP
ncbi:MAG: hypothetical protein U0359_12800 [Byssovorax sp.]